MGSFDEQVRGVGTGAGEGYPYFIETADGRIAAGRLDSSEQLSRIYTDAASGYIVYWDEEALVKQEA